jgi:hypothetical protein
LALLQMAQEQYIHAVVVFVSNSLLNVVYTGASTFCIVQGLPSMLGRIPDVQIHLCSRLYAVVFFLHRIHT